MTGGKMTRPRRHAFWATAGAWTCGGIVWSVFHLLAPAVYSVDETQRLATSALIGTVFVFVLVERISSLVEFERAEREERRTWPERQRRMDEALAALRSPTEVAAVAGMPVGLCGNREDHEPHLHHSRSLGKFWCSADQETRLPYAADRKNR
jgi:hypothetical protein